MITIISENWNEWLKKFHISQQDIYYYEEYVKLYETDSSKALCAICHEEDLVLLFPFIRKKIGNYYDLETAYGYGGPISNTNDAIWINHALIDMENFFRANNYVCGFIRYHSLLNNEVYCRNSIKNYFDRNTISIKTNLPEEEIWIKQISSKCRNMIRKAEKNGLVYKAEYDFASIYDFIELYNITMKRLNADDFYYFNENYYMSFVKNFKNKAFLGTIRKDGELICAALFMYSGKYGHYHLEGSNNKYSNLGSNNLLLWKAALEFRNLGIEEFHLGGGYDSSPDNTLLKFKKSFSNNTKDFYIGKWVFNDEKYNEIKNEWKLKNPDKIEKYENFLLCYRY